MIFELKIQKRLKSAIEYTRIEDAQKFSMDYYYDYAKTIDKQRVSKIMMIESSGRNINRDYKVISEVNAALENGPEAPFDIVIFRGGEMKYIDRPFLSASFVKDISMGFAKSSKNLHKILVKKGSKILPIYAINQLSKIGDPEMEVIFDARKLKKHIGFYEY